MPILGNLFSPFLISKLTWLLYSLCNVPIYSFSFHHHLLGCESPPTQLHPNGWPRHLQAFLPSLEAMQCRRILGTYVSPAREVWKHKSIYFLGSEHTEANRTITCTLIRIGHIVSYDDYCTFKHAGAISSYTIFSSLFMAHLVSLECTSFLDGSCW